MQLTTKFTKKLNHKEHEEIKLCASLCKTLCSLWFLNLVFRGFLYIKNLSGNPCCCRCRRMMQSGRKSKGFAILQDEIFRLLFSRFLLRNTCLIGRHIRNDPVFSIRHFPCSIENQLCAANEQIKIYF